MKPVDKLEEPLVAYGHEINAFDQLDLTRLYSYADYFKWKFSERVELIKGMVHPMSPAPSPTHQSVSGNLFFEFKSFLKGTSCMVFSAPFDVRLSHAETQADDKIMTVVQPDICVICRPEKIDTRGCAGAPDLIVEVLSPGNTTREMGVKFDLYEKNKVKEYWLADPEHKIILVYVLRGHKYTALKPFTQDDSIISPSFPGLNFKIRDVFAWGSPLMERYDSLKQGYKVGEPTVAYGDEILSFDQLDITAPHSYADYLKWKFSERVELIRGHIHKMSPAPGLSHQKTARKLVGKIENLLKDEKCELFFTPFDLRLPDLKKRADDHLVSTVVQPDICIICAPHKMDAHGCIGAPDLIIEILSPGNSKREMNIKYDLYEENGVREYWMADPQNNVILVYVLRDDRYSGLKPFTEEDELVSPSFPELKFRVREVFE